MKRIEISKKFFLNQTDIQKAIILQLQAIGIIKINFESKGE